MQFDGILFQQNKSLSPDPFDFLKIKISTLMKIFTTFSLYPIVGFDEVVDSLFNSIKNNLFFLLYVGMEMGKMTSN